MSSDNYKVTLAGQALIEQPIDGETAQASRLIEEIRASDLAVTNFEGTLDAPHTWPLKTKTMHVATPAALESLRKLGFNALALANNHAFDLGPPALTAIRTHAQACGFATAGSGDDIGAAGAPGIVVAGGRRAALLAFDLGPQLDMVYAGPQRAGINPLRIRSELAMPADDVARLAAISQSCGYAEKFARRVQVGYSDAGPVDSLNFFGINVKSGELISEHRYADRDDLARALQAIRSARADADLVVVSAHNHHWESNWAAAPAWLTALCAELVDAGADIVFCHGAPVLQGMTLHRGRPIFHGLGNLIFHTARAPRYDNAGIDVWRGAIAICQFNAENTLHSVCIQPIQVGLPLSKCNGATIPSAPRILEGPQAEETVNRFLDHSTLSGVDVNRDDGTCVIRVPAINS